MFQTSFQAAICKGIKSKAFWRWSSNYDFNDLNAKSCNVIMAFDYVFIFRFLVLWEYPSLFYTFHHFPPLLT